MFRSLTSLLLLLILVGPGCGPRTVEKNILQLAVAANLYDAVNDLVAEFQKTHQEANIKVAWGSSGNLYNQIEQGAPYHLFFSADVSYPEKLHQKGLSTPPQIYGRGRIVMWTSDKALSLDKTGQVLLSDQVERIAVANPRYAPYGKGAVAWLKKKNLWEKVKDKVIYGKNVSQTAQFGHTGNVEVAFISLSLARSEKLQKEGKYHLCDSSLHPRLDQALAVLKAGKDHDLTRKFLAFLDTKPAQKILRQYGYELP